MTTRDALCVALDGSDRGWIAATAARLAGTVGWLKIGLEAFTAHGPSVVREVAATGARVFLDLKLHDIPTTVRRAIANCAASGADLVNVHASGGREMLVAAVDGARSGERRPLVVAVTVLTSLDRPALAGMGFDIEPLDLVRRWASLARDAGLDGVVASACEAPDIRRDCGDDFLIVTPGIRPTWAAVGDQRRVVSPRDALAAGSDLLVVGRPITSAPDPLAAAERVLAEMRGATGVPSG